MSEPVNGHQQQAQAADDGTRVRFAIEQTTGKLILVCLAGSLQVQLDFGTPEAAEPLVKQMTDHALYLINTMRQAQNLAGLQLPGMPGFGDLKPPTN